MRIEVGSITKPVEQVDLHVLRSRTGPQAGAARNHAARQRPARSWSSPAPSTAPTAWRSSSAQGGAKTAAIHGDRSQNQRNQALKGFQDGYYRVLVATDVAARGIHVEGISHVVNYDLPQVPEDFIHRVGRTGRAGARGTASHLRHALGARRNRPHRTDTDHPHDAAQDRLTKPLVCAMRVRLAPRKEAFMQQAPIVSEWPTRT